MTAKELIEHLKKFNDDALIQLVTDKEVFEVDVDKESPCDKEYESEVCLFIGERIG